jgi:hypothetical protein
VPVKYQGEIDIRIKITIVGMHRAKITAAARSGTSITPTRL